MNKTTLLTLAAALAASSVLCESSRAAVHSQPDGSNALEQRVQKLGAQALAVQGDPLPQPPDYLARAWGNGEGRACANGGGRGFANAYRGGFANW